MKKYRIKVKKPWIAYPGSTIQQNYAEGLSHGWLKWDIKDRESYDVSYEELPNPKPFVTLTWQGNVAATMREAQQFPKGSRFRVVSEGKIPHKDSHALTLSLNKELDASEITWKAEGKIDRSIVSTGTTTIVKDDLRNVDVLYRLLREYYVTSDMHEQEWHKVYDLLKRYLSRLASEATPRNVQWSLRRLDFHNLFGYGENNTINFDDLSGIVGIFGPNRAGKSSIPGALLYTLFNGTDRGSIKNLHVCNSRKTSCSGRAIFKVNGNDYVVERTTTKNENKRGEVNASTSLFLARIDNGTELVELNGEQRTDTDKKVRKLIGTQDDCELTALSTQGDIDNFIKFGPTKRKQIISRFLDVSVMHQLHDFANKDVNTHKAVLKRYNNVDDYDELEQQKHEELVSAQQTIHDKIESIKSLTFDLDDKKSQLAKHGAFTPITKDDVTAQENRVQNLEAALNKKASAVAQIQESLKTTQDKAQKAAGVVAKWNLAEMQSTLDMHNQLKMTVKNLKLAYDTETSTLDRHHRSLKILSQVPCGDNYPTCKFIKDAHKVKNKVAPQEKVVEKAKEALDDAQKSLDSANVDQLEANIKKVTLLKQRQSELELQASKYEIEVVTAQNEYDRMLAESKAEKERLEVLRQGFIDDENEEVATLKRAIDEIENKLRVEEREKLAAASRQGRAQSELEQVRNERLQRAEAMQQMKAYEIIANGFSKKGIPNTIVSSLLPTINEEVNKILSGIVNFAIELEREKDGDNIDIYLNYGDSRRILELGSGMEKTFSSLAIRAALTNISSLPKPDFLIIDEGFGTLDESGVEACNRMLYSLKRYFKTIIIVTHVDGVKDIADTVLEITKKEKDSRIVYN